MEEEEKIIIRIIYGLFNFQLLSQIKTLTDRRPAIVIQHNLRMCIVQKNTGGVSL